MKYCSRPFNFMWVTRSFDEKEKQMTLPCAWLSITGLDDTDLTRYSVEEVWNSETFNKVRESIKDGSFRYCNCTTCPFISNDSLKDLDGKKFERAVVPQEYPTFFDLAYDRSCNHACPSCRHEIYKGSKEAQRDTELIGEKLLPYLNKAEFIDSNGQGDFFASAANVRLFNKLKPENPNLAICIETNGTLFDEPHWNKVRHLNCYNIEVNITPSSFDQATYAYLNGGFDLLDKLEDNLRFIKGLRERKEINKLTLITIVQDVNVKEVPSFIKKCLDEYNADLVTLRPIYKWNFLTEEEHWFKNVANPLHPYYQYYKELQESDIMKNPKVYSWGITNKEAPKQHPAYIYKDIAEKLAKLVSKDNVVENLNQYFGERDIKEVIVYGKGLLGQTLLDILSREHANVKVTRVLCRENLNEYIPDKEDVILITNYHNANAVRRDLAFMGFDGLMIDADKMIDSL